VSHDDGRDDVLWIRIVRRQGVRLVEGTLPVPTG
jgi:hypothetical protein